MAEWRVATLLDHDWGAVAMQEEALKTSRTAAVYDAKVGLSTLS